MATSVAAVVTDEVPGSAQGFAAGSGYFAPWRIARTLGVDSPGMRAYCHWTTHCQWRLPCSLAH